MYPLTLGSGSLEDSGPGRVPHDSVFQGDDQTRHDCKCPAGDGQSTNASCFDTFNFNVIVVVVLLSVSVRCREHAV